MRIIPVMDLLGGRAVHAVRGERSRYLPITNRLTAGGDPFALARAYREQLGLAELYVADLDAIQRRGSHAGLIARLAEESGLALMVDAGAADAEQARQVLALGVRKVIFGAETAPDWDAVARVRAAVPADRLTFSLDMRAGQVLSGCPQLTALSPQDLLARLGEQGWQEAILLDLARVGTGAGIDLELIAAAHRQHPEITLLAGGGVRDAGDLRALAAAGAGGALVATALHNGALGRQTIEELAGQPGSMAMS